MIDPNRVGDLRAIYKGEIRQRRSAGAIFYFYTIYAVPYRLAYALTSLLLVLYVVVLETQAHKVESGLLCVYMCVSFNDYSRIPRVVSISPTSHIDTLIDCKSRSIIYTTDAPVHTWDEGYHISFPSDKKEGQSRVRSVRRVLWRECDESRGKRWRLDSRLNTKRDLIACQ